MKITSYFEISKDAELAADDDGHFSEAYLEVSTEHSRSLSDSEMTDLHEAHRQMVARQMGMPTEYLREITEAEYHHQVDEEEEAI